jgi:hypothetical protein
MDNRKRGDHKAALQQAMLDDAACEPFQHYDFARCNPFRSAEAIDEYPQAP